MSDSLPAAPLDMRTAKFRIGQVVKHRVYPFRGVIFDVDRSSPTPKGMVRVDPPENPAEQTTLLSPLPKRESTYIAYVSSRTSAD